jgi:aerobic carbon-monoxide dehydrogenase small subunit
MDITLTVNGRQVTASVEPNTLLSALLRDGLALTGTHVACDTSQCGACTVLVDGVSVKSCTLLAAEAAGAQVVTIEGLATNGALHPMQQAFHEHHGLQCGYCTPGMLMAATHLLATVPSPTEGQIREALSGNLCRCTGYTKIVDAVGLAARRMEGEDR